MKERYHGDGTKVYKNIVYINGINENGMEVVIPNGEVDQRMTTTLPDLEENKIYNYFVFEGRKADQPKKAPATVSKNTEPKVEIDPPKAPQVSFIFTQFGSEIVNALLI